MYLAHHFLVFRSVTLRQHPLLNHLNFPMTLTDRSFSAYPLKGGISWST